MEARQKKLEEERARILAAQEKRKAQEETRKREEERLELEKKKYSIGEIIKKRGITRIVHFTRIENLESILEYGFIPRMKLEKMKKDYIKNDEERREKMTNCTCFSVMFPNSYLFKKFRDRNMENKWVVILLDSKVLLDSSFKKFFCYHNAARSDLRQKLWNGKLTTAWDFEPMFKETDSYSRTNGSGVTIRSEIIGIRDFLPTAEQDEILITGIIPTSYIQEVIFENEDDLNLYKQTMKNKVKFENYKYYINNCLFKEEFSEFKFYTGFAVIQKQKSIISFHNSIIEKNKEFKILEVSTKSTNPVGVALSAFNPKFLDEANNKEFPLENIFQSSKVFENGGPYRDLLYVQPKEAKRDERLTTSGKLINFNYNEQVWGLEPKTMFYDWIYIKALYRNKKLCEEIVKYDTFTDIEFNHEKSINCQARAAAIFVSLFKLRKIEEVLGDINKFKEIYGSKFESGEQISLFM